MKTLLPVNSPQEIGEAVRLVRRCQGIIQTDMAEMIGKSHVHLRDIEKGKGTVSLGSVLKVLDELGIRVYLDLPER